MNYEVLADSVSLNFYIKVDVDDDTHKVWNSTKRIQCNVCGFPDTMEVLHNKFVLAKYVGLAIIKMKNEYDNN